MERENLAGDVKGKGTSGSNREAEKFSERGRSVWLRNEVATVIQAKGREKIFRSIVTAPA